MERKRLLGMVAAGMAFALAVLAVFTVHFQPHRLAPFVARTWTGPDGSELSDWPWTSGALRCPRHQAYHTDGLVCLDVGPGAGR